MACITLWQVEYDFRVWLCLWSGRDLGGSRRIGDGDERSPYQRLDTA